MLKHNDVAIRHILKQNENFLISDDKAITYKDYHRIINLIRKDVGKAHVLPLALHKLFLFATNSEKYNSHKMPENIVTLNSEVILASDTQQKQLVKIVLPEDISGKHDISVYSPIGMACLGAKEKDHVFVKYKNGRYKLLIEKIVFQPEREMKLY